MKVIAPKQMAQIESQAFRDGSSETDFMEEAGSGVALIVHDFVEKYGIDRHVILLCGKGNNGGDAYVAGVHLIHLDYDVYAYQLAPFDECSPLCQQNQKRFLDEGGRLKEISSVEEIAFPIQGVIVDGIFGTGFHGQVDEFHSSLIRFVNATGIPTIAVDIPSGLDGETGLPGGEAIIARETAFLGLPKTGFFIGSGWDYVGKLRYIDFGLPQEYIEEADADLIMLSQDIVKPLLPRIRRSRHKYEAGYVVALAGSPGMPGAAVLASLAALRGGAGIVRLLHPEGMQEELTATPYEIIKEPYSYDNPKAVVELLNKASAVLIGPGMGRSSEAESLLKEILPQIQKPTVLDADALFHLAHNNIPLPEKTILTPHKGELLRLLGISSQEPLNESFLRLCQSYANEKRVTLLMKGGPTFIFHPDETVFVNPTGDPGMATAGSGDVLTGLLAGLLAEGLTTLHAAQLGVYLHGIAGEHASEELTPYCMTASDVLFYFPEAFKFIEV